MALDTLAREFATEAAWVGHLSEARAAAKASPEVIARAIELGLVTTVPRLGGYTASRKVTAKALGAAAASLGR